MKDNDLRINILLENAKDVFEQLSEEIAKEKKLRGKDLKVAGVVRTILAEALNRRKIQHEII